MNLIKKTVHEYNAVHAGSSFIRFSAKPFLKTEFKGSGLSRRALSFINVCVSLLSVFIRGVSSPGWERVRKEGVGGGI